MTRDNVVDPAARDKYLLQVTAGPTYDPSTHEEVGVNGSESTKVESDSVTCWIRVRIKDYHGLPYGSPATSPYFDHQLHKSDRYSVAFSFIPKEDLPGQDIVMGFDYDHSIKHQLPPGFKYAMKIATTMLDPGLYSDPYSDNPYLYGPALSGFFSLNIGELVDEVPAESQLATLESENKGVIEEGAIGSGQSIRDELGLPPKWKKRRRHFLTTSNLEKFTFEKGRMYHTDFFNPYLDFANFALRLPGFSISVARYIDEKTHHLRFVVKNRKKEKELFVIFFRLLFGRELEEMLESRKKEKGQANGENGTIANAQNGDTEQRDEQKRIDSPREGELDDISSPDRRGFRHTEDSSSEENVAVAPSNAVTTMAGRLYSAFASMTFRDEPSSSEDEARSRASSIPASSRSLDARVDDMADQKVEKFLQSKNSNV